MCLSAMTATGRSRGSSPARGTPPTWAACSRTWASATSAPIPPRPKAVSSGCGRPCRIAWRANCVCAASRPPRPPRPTCRSSSPTSMRASPIPRPRPLPSWRRPPRDLALVLSCRYTRVVARDHTIRLGERRVQLPSRAHGRGYAGLRVEVRELLDGRLVVRHDGRVLATQPSPGPDFVLTPRRAPSTERQGRRQRQATEMRKALTELARAEKQRPAGLTTDLIPDAARAEPAGGAPTHDRQGGCSVDTLARARNSPRAQWRPAPSHPWRRAVTSAVAAKKRQKPIPPGG